ncbi:MAG: plasmid mobilization relaxosome protein MobC [Firmicutes bacterium]|nr:plasmid mobilization relaxosome protein MobC [Bacillota bacterium]
MTENRKRNQTLTVRLTAAEKDAITRNAAKARMSLTDYIVASSLLTEIHVAEDTRPLLTELKRIGNNLNQISMKINSGVFTSYNFQEVIQMQKAIYEELYMINRGAPWQP